MQEQGGIDVAAAARRLGISATAVRRRIQRQTVRAQKADDGTWRIVLPDIPEGSPEDRPESAPRDSPPDTLLDLLRDQLIEKDRQLRAAEIERAELRRLLGNAQQQVSRLLAATATDGTEGAEAEDEVGTTVRTPKAPLRGVREAEHPLWKRIVQAIQRQP